MTASVSEAELVDQLASRVNLLFLRAGDPERFHAEKSDIALQLRRLARRLAGDAGRRRDPTTVWRAK